ncbi:hypothetical protein [Pseudarthrobacter cellobiosi]|uniref:hypothetical protein n=1 Tax=Pseudarthrobacter cellobiosi TaxID=2953654 RepID=UPI00208FCBE6|nr:hypothetical protein [Pseudarthrobacter sp. HLT1-5]MCO4257451.1 hypothetical protein [Pseudarthrobacter sp. HLT1-5]
MGAAGFMAVGGVVIALRSAGLLQGVPGLILAGVLFLLVPTTKVLSQRILFNGLIVTGLIPLSWWIPERFVGIDHGTILLATLAGLLSGWILSARSIPPRLHRLLPHVRGVDALPFLAAVMSALSLYTMLTIRIASDALSIMMSRWDYNSHFSIYYMIRSGGGVIPTIPTASDGAAWGFGEYPQGFHTLLATVSQILRPKIVSLDSELVSYINLQAACSVFTVLIVVAGMCSLPAVRRRQAIMATGVAVASAAWIYGPGSIPVYEGFANFYLACGMAVATVLALLTFQRRIPVIGVAAVGAGLVGIANNWLLLLSLVAVVLLAKLWVIGRSPKSYNRRWWILTAAATGITLLGVALPVLQIAPLIRSSQAILEATGGIAFPDFGLALVTLAMALVLGICNRSAVARTDWLRLKQQRIDVSMAAAGLLVPIALCIWLAVTQSLQNGEISYYFHKYLIAVLLLAWPLTVAAAATLIPVAPRHEPARRQPARTAALGLLGVTATQVFGFTVPGLETVGLPPTAKPLVELASQASHIKSTPAYVHRLIESARDPQAASTIYIPAASTVDPVLAARWHWGMRAMASSTTTDLSFQVVDIAKDYSQAPQVIARILAEHPSMTAIVDPELFPQVHGYLLAHGDASRLVPVP